MNTTLKKSISFFCLFFAMWLQADSCCTTNSSKNDCEKNFCHSLFIPRSQGVAAYRHYPSMHQFLQTTEEHDPYYWLTTAVEYSQNFNRDELGKYFSFKEGCNSFVVGPDTTFGGTDTDIRNVDLGLSETFKSTITLNPRIRNLVIEPFFYVNLDHHLKGAWFSMYVPITWTQWNLNCCENIEETGGDTLTAGSVINDATTPNVGAKSALDAFAGNSTFGDKRKGLQCCKIQCCDDTRWGVADITMQLGWDFVQREDWNFGWYLNAVAPTGNTVTGEHIFEARIGTNRWQLGGGFKWHSFVWECSEDTQLHLYANMNVSHLFARRECRCFDLKDNECGSKYLLLKQFDANGEYDLALANFADIFSVKIRSHLPWQVEGIVGLQCNFRNWDFDFGYNLWARARERFDCDKIQRCKCSTGLDGKLYGIKGLEPVGDGQGQVNENTKPSSTIKTSGTTQGQEELKGFISENNFYDMLDFNKDRAPRAISHTLFLYGQHVWKQENWTGFLGAGARVEFGQDNNALDNWGLWLKAGFGFN